MLVTEKDLTWFDPGSFWSDYALPLETSYWLGDEIAVFNSESTITG
ncbi:hypothetical protein [Mycobacterium lepromatosis]